MNIQRYKLMNRSFNFQVSFLWAINIDIYTNVERISPSDLKEI